MCTDFDWRIGNFVAHFITKSFVNDNKGLLSIPLDAEGRTGHLPTLLRELVQRLRTPHVDEGKAKISLAALAHGRVRSEQGYTAAMLVEESRILQVCIFKTLRTNLSALDLSLVLTDVMTIADEVDSQLRQTMLSFSEKQEKSRKSEGQTARAKNSQAEVTGPKPIRTALGSGRFATA